MFAPAFFKKAIKFETCGSIAHDLIIVFPCLKTFATIRFSVQVTPKLAFKTLFPFLIFQYNAISSPIYLYLYQIASSPFK
jgi:hypothetical protein